MTPRIANGPTGSAARLTIDTAAQLLNFRGSGASSVSEHVADEQLKGAVAIHNILQEEGCAYLADEVGMGKTYVALGALALFRHFDPGFRVLVIAPRQNIQKKWLKELRNFVARNVIVPDMRVKALHGAPARATVLCNSLPELVRETAIDADRDFFARLTSFSFALGKNSTEGWKSKRDHLLAHLPWIDPALFDLRNREQFKDNFARAVNCALPVFDLVIFDEGHNIKGGRAGAASRNRMLALAFGHPAEVGNVDERFRGYGARAKRVLFLSATPLENDYVQLWNQLDVFGFGSGASVLADPNASDEDKREWAQRFLIRRVTTLPVAGAKLTKNLYRREWRGGGVASHDDAITVPGEMQRLTVALVQKKVSEVLGGARFNNSFQIGMLASFESFLETARAKPNGDSGDVVGNFDGDQSDVDDERLGADVGSVNNLARSYRRKFGAELPHPKMDAVVEQLASAFRSGEKSLVFVRRVASVTELRRKLEEQYDAYLFQRLRAELKPALRPAMEQAIEQYQADRAHEVTRRNRNDEAEAEGAELDEESVVEDHVPPDEGGLDSFFAWFFRGDGPEGRILSGATIQKRFSQAGAVSSTFFEDNHVSALLDATRGSVTAALGAYLGLPRPDLESELSARAAIHLSKAKRQPRRNLFFAFQQAAISLLMTHDGPLKDRARIVHEERYMGGNLSGKSGLAERPALEDWLELATFWTGLRERAVLRQALWPEPKATDFRARFREAELRRELLSAMARLGHPFIDLYILSVNRLDRLELRAREVDEEGGGDLISDFLDLLEKQRHGGGGHTSYLELVEAARNFDLILTVNEPKVREEPLASATTLFGRLLRAQQPVGGMSGQVNETLVRQFRMPGYPMILVTTDLLQEGEDLHTFCSSVHHYGMSWMPSSMEQRVGRVDRVSSSTDRRLSNAVNAPAGEELLQVYYPHLQDTVEVLQVRRVLERLNRFMRLMHENIGATEAEERKLDVGKEILRVNQDLEPIREPLRTAFPIRDEMLAGPPRPLATDAAANARLHARFLALRGQQLGDHEITWDSSSDDAALYGTFRLISRQQPFTLLLRSVEGHAVVRCVSPVGMVDQDDVPERIVRAAARGSGVRVGAVMNQELNSYNLTIEGDVLLGADGTDVARVGWLLENVTRLADSLELSLLGTDRPMTAFQPDITTEATYER